MKGASIIALVIVSSIVACAGAAGSPARSAHPGPGEFRRITSRRDLIFGHLIGRSEAEVIAIKGEPAARKPEALVYRQRLGPGAHSFRYSWVVKFKRGKVVEVEELREAVGCILIPPPREWR